MFDDIGQPASKPQGHGATPGVPMPPINTADQPPIAPGKLKPPVPPTPDVVEPKNTSTSPGPVDDIFIHTDRSQPQAPPVPDTLEPPPPPLNSEKPSPFKAVDQHGGSIDPSPYMATSDTPPPIAGISSVGAGKKAQQNSKKKYFIIGLIGLAIIGGTAFAWWFFSLNSEPVQKVVPTSNQQQNQPVVVPTVVPVESTIPTPLVPDVPPPTDIQEPTAPIVDVNLDSDLDGLTDLREKKLGTSPVSNDTDRDGLFDRDEVEIYLTDPLLEDTDGDGFTDGEEVRNGYNPNGSGTLVQ